MSTVQCYQYALGPMDNLCYLLESKGEIWSVDPAWDPSFLSQEIESLGGTLKGILLTHGHHDHTNGVLAIQETFSVPVYVSNQELPQLLEALSLNRYYFESSDPLTVGDHTIEVIATPGHSPGCVCFRIGRILLSGDTLFIDGCGRADLTGSDPEALYEALETLKQLPDEIVVYPGHDYGPSQTDTMGHQKQTNPYLTAESKKIFLRKRMGFT